MVRVQAVFSTEATRGITCTWFWVAAASTSGSSVARMGRMVIPSEFIAYQSGWMASNQEAFARNEALPAGSVTWSQPQRWWAGACACAGPARSGAGGPAPSCGLAAVRSGVPGDERSGAPETGTPVGPRVPPASVAPLGTRPGPVGVEPESEGAVPGCEQPNREAREKAISRFLDMARLQQQPTCREAGERESAPGAPPGSPSVRAMLAARPRPCGARAT